MYAVVDQLPRLGKRELICLLLFTCNYVVSAWRSFLFLWVLGMSYVILLWYSLSLPYNYFETLRTKPLCQTPVNRNTKVFNGRNRSLILWSFAASCWVGSFCLIPLHLRLGTQICQVDNSSPPRHIHCIEKLTGRIGRYKGLGGSRSKSK